MSAIVNRIATYLADMEARKPDGRTFHAMHPEVLLREAMDAIQRTEEAAGKLRQERDEWKAQVERVTSPEYLTQALEAVGAKNAHTEKTEMHRRITHQRNELRILNKHLVVAHTMVTAAYGERDAAKRDHVAAHFKSQETLKSARQQVLEDAAKVADAPLMHRKGRVGLWRQRRAEIAAAIRALAQEAGT